MKEENQSAPRTAALKVAQVYNLMIREGLLDYSLDSPPDSWLSLDTTDTGLELDCQMSCSVGRFQCLLCFSTTFCVRPESGFSDGRHVNEDIEVMFWEGEGRAFVVKWVYRDGTFGSCQAYLTDDLDPELSPGLGQVARRIIGELPFQERLLTETEAMRLVLDLVRFTKNAGARRLMLVQ
ncbi:MAG: hypothetical protein V1821_00490 [bacterium]